MSKCVLLFCFWVFTAGTGNAQTTTTGQFFSAIRNNDLTQVRTLSKSRQNLEAQDARGTTPLIYAAAFGSVESLRILLEAGADVNAQNAQDVTALIWGAWDPARVKLLLAKGANPNATSKQGRTPLIAAAAVDGNEEAVELLLAKGADARAKDGMGVTALALSSRQSGVRMLRMLFAAGAEVNEADRARFTPIMSAVSTENLEAVHLLLSKGANVNVANTFGGKVKHGNIELTGLTPLLMAAPQGSPEIVKTLLAAGADVNARDGRGMTPLMMAVASEKQDVRVARLLLEKGADVNASSKLGETVLDWARKFGNPAMLSLLQNAGAKGSAAAASPAHRSTPPLDVRSAIAKSVDLLQRSSTEFFNQSGCVSCHSQNVTAMAVSKARAAGITVNIEASVQQAKATSVMGGLMQQTLLQSIDPPGAIDTVMFKALGLAAADVPSDQITDSLVSYLAANQRSSGHWDPAFGISRAPIEERNIARTAFAARVLQAYSWPARKTEFDQRLVRARNWLLKSDPRTSYERAELLLGLKWTGASTVESKRAAKALLDEQRPDGGWAQNAHLASDAYATGLALHALAETGTAVTDAAYRRGVDYLLKTQLEDGSWYVRSRAVKFQPYFQSGFPHDHDQWISSMATAYAVMGLAPAGTAASRQQTASR